MLPRFFGVYASAAVQRDTNLLFVERDVVLLGDFLFGDRVDVKKPVNDFTVFEVFFDDFFHVVDFDHSVKSIFGINFNERSLRAETEATNLVDGHFVVQAFFIDKFYEFFSDFVGMRGQTARTAA